MLINIGLESSVESWACHLILNRSGVVLDYSAGVKEAPGQATDQWIVKGSAKTKEGKNSGLR